MASNSRGKAVKAKGKGKDRRAALSREVIVDSDKEAADDDGGGEEAGSQQGGKSRWDLSPSPPGSEDDEQPGDEAEEAEKEEEDEAEDEAEEEEESGVGEDDEEESDAGEDDEEAPEVKEDSRVTSRQLKRLGIRRQKIHKGAKFVKRKVKVAKGSGKKSAKKSEKTSGKKSEKKPAADRGGDDDDDDDAGKMEDENKCIEWHDKLKDFGLKVMSPKLDNDAAAVAAYMRYESTGEMQDDWSAQPKDVRRHWSNFYQLRSQGYTIPGKTKALPIEKKKFFDTVKKVSSRNDLLPLTQIDRVTLDEEAFDNLSNSDSSYAYYIWIATAFALIRDLPARFPDSHANKASYRGPRYAGAAAEDIARAYFWMRCYTSVRQRDKNLTKYPGFKLARTLRWYEGRVQAKGTGVGSATRDADAAPSAPSASCIPLDPKVFGVRKRKEHAHIDLANPADVLRSVTTLEEEYLQEMAGDTPEDFDPEERLTELVQEITKTTKVGFLQRPPLSEEERREWLWSAGQAVTVKHDEFPDHQALDAKLDTTYGTGDVVANAEAELVEDASGDTSGAPTDEFWKLRETLAGRTTQNVPRWTEACLELGYTQEQADAGPQAIRVQGSKFQPEVAQIIAAAWMRKMENGPLGGGLLALDAGLGKTLTSLFHCVKQAEELDRLMPRHDDLVAKPTLVVCPAVVIHVWYGEIMTWFKDQLTPRLYYSNEQEDTLSKEQKDFLLPTNPEDAALELKKLYKPNNPASARVVVLTSYETHTARNCVPTQRGLNRAALKSEGIDDPELALDESGIMDDDEDYDPAEAYDRELPAHLAQKRSQAKDNTTDDEAYVYTNPMRGIFERVLIDEGQRIKNSRSKAHRAIFCAYAETHFIVSATPIFNSITDLHGYLSLFWRASWSVAAHTNSQRQAGDWMYNAQQRKLFREVYPQYGQAIKNWRAETKLDLFALDPRHFVRQANRGGLEGEQGLDTISTLLSLLQLKITTATPMEVNGEVVRAGQNIKPYESVVVELEGTELEQDMLKNIWSVYFQHLNKGGTNESGMKKGLRDGSVHRLLEVVPFDLRLFHVIREAYGRAKDVDLWTSHYDDRGASQYFNLVRENETYPPYATRWEMLCFIASTSPKLRYLCRILYRCMYTDVPPGALADKLLIFCNWPIELWVLGFFLGLLGIEYLELKAGQTLNEKEEIIGAFNDPDHPARVCIASFKTTAVGVNLHRACHKICMMGFPSSLAVFFQAVGRAHRLGQLKDQQIWVIGVDHSYDMYQQGTISQKFKGEVLGQATLHKKRWRIDERARLKADMKARATADKPYSDHAYAKEVQRISDEYVNDQVNLLIRKIVGFRCVREGYNNQSLTFKDTLPDNVSTPKKVRAFQRVVIPPAPPVESAGAGPSSAAVESAVAPDVGPVRPRESTPTPATGLHAPLVTSPSEEVQYQGKRRRITANWSDSSDGESGPPAKKPRHMTPAELQALMERESLHRGPAPGEASDDAKRAETENAEGETADPEQVDDGTSADVEVDDDGKAADVEVDDGKTADVEVDDGKTADVEVDDAKKDDENAASVQAAHEEVDENPAGARIAEGEVNENAAVVPAAHEGVDESEAAMEKALADKALGEALGADDEEEL